MSDNEFSPQRRAVTKAAVGGAVGITLWSEPTIRGLARRPAYAGVGSSVCDSFPAGEYPDPVMSANDLIQMSIQPGPGSSQWLVQLDIVSGDETCTFDVSNIEITLKKGSNTGTVTTIGGSNVSTFVEISGRPDIVGISADITVTCS